MALVLLNPGLRPLGQFDMEDDNATNMSGGEYVELTTIDVSSEAGAEAYAADVGTGGSGTGIIQGSAGDNVHFALAQRAQSKVVYDGTTVAQAGAYNLGGLCDEGTDDYGTLFGQGIGGTAGGGTGLGTLSTRGVVTLGPRTSFGSGKVTVWHQQGLYGITSDAFSAASAPAATTDLNTALYSDSADTTASNLGKWTTDSTLAAGSEESGQLGINVGFQRDRSLVSTTSSAVGATATNEHMVVFYLGNAAV